MPWPRRTGIGTPGSIVWSVTRPPGAYEALRGLKIGIRSRFQHAFHLYPVHRLQSARATPRSGRLRTAVEEIKPRTADRGANLETRFQQLLVKLLRKHGSLAVVDVPVKADRHGDVVARKFQRDQRGAAAAAAEINQLDARIRQPCRNCRNGNGLRAWVAGEHQVTPPVAFRSFGKDGVSRKMHDVVALPGLVGVGGFAKSFIELGARAVIAPLWGVKDEFAHEVAKTFYQRLSTERDTPFAEILRDLRRKAYEPAAPRILLRRIASTAIRRPAGKSGRRTNWRFDLLRETPLLRQTKEPRLIFSAGAPPFGTSPRRQSKRRRAPTPPCCGGLIDEPLTSRPIARPAPGPGPADRTGPRLL